MAWLPWRETGFNLSSTRFCSWVSDPDHIRLPQQNPARPRQRGSLVDHVTFKVRDLEASTTHEGIVTGGPLRSAGKRNRVAREWVEG